MTNPETANPAALNTLSLRVSQVFPARKWKVLRLLTKIENYKNYLPNVKECRVLEKTRGSALTLWKADIEGIPLTWKEEDTFDFENFAVSFRAIEGDLEKFEGRWRLEDLPTHGDGWVSRGPSGSDCGAKVHQPAGGQATGEHDPRATRLVRGGRFGVRQRCARGFLWAVRSRV